MTRWPYAVLSSCYCRCRYVAKWVELVEVGGWIGILNININIGVACGTLQCCCCICCCCWLITFTCCRSAGSIATSVACVSLSLMSLLLMCVRCVIRHIYQAYSSVRQDSEEERKRCALNQKSQQKAKQSKAATTATTNWQQQLPTGNIGGNRSGSVRQLNQPIRRQVQQLQPATLLSFPAALPPSLSCPALLCCILLAAYRMAYAQCRRHCKLVEAKFLPQHLSGCSHTYYTEYTQYVLTIYSLYLFICDYESL